MQRASAQEPLALRSLSRSDARSAAGLRTNNAASSLRRPLSRLAKRLEGMPKNHQRKRFACEAESCNAAGPGADDRRLQQFVTLTPDAPGALPRQRLRVAKVMGAGQGRRSVVPGCVSIAPGVSPLHRVCAYVYFWAFQVQWGSVREWAESTAEARSIATCSVFSPATWMLVVPPPNRFVRDASGRTARLWGPLNTLLGNAPLDLAGPLNLEVEFLLGLVGPRPVTIPARSPDSEEQVCGRCVAPAMGDQVTSLAWSSLALLRYPATA